MPLLTKSTNDSLALKDGIALLKLPAGPLDIATDGLVLADAVTVYRPSAEMHSDALLLRGEWKFLLTHSLTFSEQLAFSDTLKQVKDFRYVFASDADNLDDALNTLRQVVKSTNTVEDMENWDDNVRILRSGEDISYLRRDLDDVI